MPCIVSTTLSAETSGNPLSRSDLKPRPMRIRHFTAHFPRIESDFSRCVRRTNWPNSRRPMHPPLLRDCSGRACCGESRSLNHSTLIVICEAREAENREPSLTPATAGSRRVGPFQLGDGPYLLRRRRRCILSELGNSESVGDKGLLHALAIPASDSLKSAASGSVLTAHHAKFESHHPLTTRRAVAARQLCRVQ